MRPGATSASWVGATFTSTWRPRRGSTLVSFHAMGMDPGVSSPRNSVSTASDITLNDWNLEGTDRSMVVDVDGDADHIPMTVLSGEPIAGLRRITQAPPTRWQRLCLGDPVGVFILLSVVLGLLLFVYSIPWLASTEAPSTPAPSTLSTPLSSSASLETRSVRI